ncbi:hypothetical protein C5167_019056 [Papaver somniferum]|uniref:Uncharacterized protein n=1 Tax=Papaver somniferum TaxID=3469 RepID=A0A4Y7IS58_PAPSO|nr:hypothetical protein C5167_019056 [Papaver somniferum]
MSGTSESTTAENGTGEGEYYVWHE